MIDMSKTLYAPDRAEWRAWLEKNHALKDGIWLIYYKKHTGKPSIPYEDAVDEALCFGWIDSTMQRIDEERYAQKYTPRCKKSKWSDLNKKRVEKLIKEGRMTEAGLEKASYLRECKKEDEPPDDWRKMDLTVPKFMEDALALNPEAEKFFSELAPSYRRQYVGWIISAKMEETRKKRLKEAIELLKQKRKLGMK